MRRLALCCTLLAGLGGLTPVVAGETILAPGQPLTGDAVAALVHTELVARGVEPEVTVDVAMPATAVPNRATTRMRVALTDLRYDRSTGRYEARLQASLETGETSVIDTFGRVQELTDIVVPARPIGRGETIGPGDVSTVRVAPGSLRGDTLRRPEDLIGLQAARFLVAGRPTRAGDVVAPWLVARGEQATMVFLRGGLEILVAGIALDQGRQGQSIRVRTPPVARCGGPPWSAHAG